DAVAGVDAHRVEVFDGADDDAVVGLVAHHFHFVFLPAEQRFLDEDFRDGRKLHAALGESVKFVAVVGDAAAGAAERERGPDDERETANLVDHGAGFVQIVRGAGNGNVEANGEHQILEDLPVFAAFDGFGFGANHLDAVFFQHTGAVKGHRGVERGLAAERREQHKFVRGLGVGVWVLGNTHFAHLLLLADDDFLNTFRRDRLDVGAVGELRVGHDGGRVGVDENDAEAFLLERFAGLRAGIIELARLADDDRSGADDEDAMNVRALGHTCGYGLNTDYARNERKLRRSDESQSSMRREGGLIGWTGFVRGLAGHRHEPHRQHGAFLQAPVLLVEQHQVLVPTRSDGDDHPATVLELFNERLRHLFRGAGDNDGIERRGFRPALVTVPGAHMNVRITETLQVGRSALRQHVNDFNGVNLPRQFGEHRGLVTRTGPDFQHAVRRLRL